jgi:Na+-transporting NADH:ubiquinone oxidoreductase subunit A
MAKIKIKKGLDLPISGSPKQEISEGKRVSTVAILGPDYAGLKPTMSVQVGDVVKEGQLLFTDKKTPGVQYTSPGSGKVVAVNRGEKRAFLSVVVEIDGDADDNNAEQFKRWDAKQLDGLTPEQVKENLVMSGLWTALRSRPFSKVPAPDSIPHSIFVTAMDTNPLSARADVVIAERANDFKNGLKVLVQLSPRGVFLCKAPQTQIPGPELPGVETNEFVGPHPAGLPGTHIHFLDPAGRNKSVWYINYQDVMAIGSLFATGRLDQRRVVSLAGPAVNEPRLIRTRIGANIAELVDGELSKGKNRLVSGSVLSGHTAYGPLAFLGRYSLQISALAEGGRRELFGWYMPWFDKFSMKNVVASKLLPGKKFPMNTSAYGSKRAIVPIGSYEKVMPLDILPTFLLKALATDDIEQAEALGCLELDEEDLALCTFVCPGKGDYGPMLRRNLTIIEKEG